MSSIGARELSRRLGLPPPTDEQAQVIEAPLGPGVVVAGAGSGKTETMAARVVWLVANELVAPDGVLGLTFTRKAANELGRRVRRRLAQWRSVLEQDGGSAGQVAVLLAGEPTVLTYAAYAGRLVAEHALRIGAEPDARLISPAVAWQLADAVSRRYPRELPHDIGAPSSVPRWVLQISGQLADHLVDVADVAAFCDACTAQFEALPPGRGAKSDTPGGSKELLSSLRKRGALLPLVAAYAAAKAALPAVDFADQMRIAAELAGVEQVRAVERDRYRAVLLDEYQDTGHAQVETLAGLFGRGHPVTAVGDPLQSIYGWRGASAGNIGRFPTRFPQADGTAAPTYPLATSFRNDRAVLDAANAVATPLRSGDQVVPPLRPAPSAGTGTVLTVRTLTVEDEASWLADRMRAAWDGLRGPDRTAAVLVRRRSQIPLLADALLSRGLPLEIVGLGGLLTTPEVADVVATLRVLVRYDLGSALARLLTGARWRIGPSDLAALRDRAQRLTPEPEAEHGSRAEQVSLIEALDDLGPPNRYSPAGFARLTALAEELRRLRQRVAAPLPELVADVEHTIGVDIEVAARADRGHVGRAHLDRFLDEAADFANDADEASLTAFLAYLDAAESEENGLEAGEVVVESERVQVLTVHGAKGLEWDVVAVPGLVGKVFPADARDVDWTRARHELPVPLRGDRTDLPGFEMRDAADRMEVGRRVAAHHDALVDRHALEERRLAYVAFTRARSTLLASGYVWDGTQKPRDPSPFLTDLLAIAPPESWAEPDPLADNPLTAAERTAVWPFDPLGPAPGEPGAGRRPAVTQGATLVRTAADQLSGAAGTLPLDLGVPLPGRAGEWHADVQRLLAERDRLRSGGRVDVELPRELSVSQLVELDRDPAELARSLRRPLPRRPAPWTRRGTRFHTWLERRWHAQTLLDLDQLPGAADETATDRDAADLEELRKAFEASVWASRTPAYVEVPFEMALAGDRVIRGRMDAVFGSDDEGWLVVDWKTGAKPTGADAVSAAVQLAAYRLAWARLCRIEDPDLHRVRAAFHYVRANQTVEPARLLDADGLRDLITTG